ncbi:MAG: CsbD family protein [Rubellimicrobium sp.]|nr:CsbD family protein [Rubellimicrobium sp.]
MNWDIVKGKWKQAMGSAKSKWGELTDDELQQIDGERERLVGKVQEKYGLAKDDAEKQVDEWADKV